MGTNNTGESKKSKGFLRKMLRAGKKRAPSVDETITSLEDSQRSTESSPSWCKPKCPIAVASKAIIEEPNVPELSLPAVATNAALSAARSSREEGNFRSSSHCSNNDANDQLTADSADRIAENDHVLYEQNVVLKSRLEALRAQQKLSGSDHPDVLFAMQSLGLVHYQRGEYQHAQRVFEERQRLTTAGSPIPREISVTAPYVQMHSAQQHHSRRSVSF